MLRLQQMSDVMKVSADTLEDIYGDCGITPPADTQRLIDDLRRLAQEMNRLFQTRLIPQ